MSSNVLVTGATGFIGSHLINRLCDDKNIHLLVAGIRNIRSDFWNEYALKDAVKSTIDLTSPIAVEQLSCIISHYHITQIYHFAAQPIVSRAKQNPLDTYKTNIMGTVNVLEAARLMEVKDVLTMSTDKVFGDGMDAELISPFQATEPYSSSKICTEYIEEDYRREFGLNVCSVRCCNVVGYDPYNPTRIVPNTILKILRGEKPIIYDIKSLRQYIFVEDVVKILRNQMGEYGLFNIGSPHICSPEEIIAPICEYMDIVPLYNETDRNFHEIKKQSLIYDKHLEYTSLEKMIQKTVNQFRTFY